GGSRTDTIAAPQLFRGEWLQPAGGCRHPGGNRGGPDAGEIGSDYRVGGAGGSDRAVVGERERAAVENRGSPSVGGRGDSASLHATDVARTGTDADAAG